MFSLKKDSWTGWDLNSQSKWQVEHATLDTERMANNGYYYFYRLVEFAKFCLLQIGNQDILKKLQYQIGFHFYFMDNESKTYRTLTIYGCILTAMKRQDIIENASEYPDKIITPWVYSDHHISLVLPLFIHSLIRKYLTLDC